MRTAYRFALLGHPVKHSLSPLMHEASFRALGIEAIAAYAKDGTKPTASEGLSFFNTGVNLVTDKPVDGVPSIDSTKGAELCWG